MAPTLPPQVLIEHHAPRLQSRQIANVIWSLGKCHKLLVPQGPPGSAARADGPSPARDTASLLLSELARGGHRKLHQAGPGAGRDAAQILHGMARLRLRRPEALRALESLILSPKQPIDIPNLALAIWGFGRVSWRSQKLLGGAAERLAAGKLYLRPWSMAALLRTYALAHYEHEGLAQAVAEVRCFALRVRVGLCGGIAVFVCGAAPVCAGTL